MAKSFGLVRRALGFVAVLGLAGWAAPQHAQATPFTTTVPGENIPLPDAYPEAGGVAIVMIGDNGNIYYQFSDPDGAFVGFQSNGQPAAFRGNPFTINNPIPLDCGIRTCTDYFGGNIDRMYVRFSAYDGDTQNNGFDEDDIDLIMNGVSVGNWSDIQTEKTNNSGTQSFGFEQGFGNNSFNTGWFSSTNQTLLNNILNSGQTTTQVLDDDPNDNYWDFRRGDSLADEELRTIAPGYEFEKTADTTTFAAVGDPIVYTYIITNIGSVNINDLTVVDDKIANVTCDTTTINQTTGGGAEEFATCQGTYLVTQEDFDNQSVTNIAKANGTPEYGSLGEVEDTVTVTGPVTLMPSVSLTKLASPQTFSAVGEEITYTYTILNDGDTTLTDIVVTDDKIPGTICSVGPLVPQAPNNQTTCTATYEVTQDDLDEFAINGNLLTNEATVEAQDPNGVTVDDMITETVSGPTAAPTLTVLKTALQPNFDAVNDLIQFEILVTNTGNVTWPTPPTITDALITGAGGTVTCPAGTVAPMASVTCTADYRIQQSDLDAEELENIAMADITVNGVAAPTGTADVTVPAVISTGLEIVKRLPAGAETTFDAVNDLIAYEYELTNTGTVTLFSPSVTDDKVNVTCTATSIPAQGSIVCTSTAPYSTTQIDLDAGFVTNTASATSQTQTGTSVDTDDTTLTVSADQTAALTLEKTATPVPAGQFTPGQPVSYSFSVQNTGNVTLTDPVMINDDKIGAPFECDAGPIPPAPAAGSTVTCTGTYNLQAEDITAGFVTNRATATSGAVTSNEDTATVSDAGAPDLGLTKTPDPVGATFSALTDTIDYIFTVENTGQTTITDALPISVSDPKITNVDCSAQPAILLPTQTFECTGTYSGITQTEIDAGEVVNTATASFQTPGGDTVTSPSSTATVPSDITPAMSLTKTGPANFGAVNSTVTFTFELTNDSAQTISTATITDPKIPSLSCDFTDIAPFDSVTCTGDYTVTQDDLDLGTIDNTATANGTAPTGELLTATASETVTVDPAAQVRALSLDKTANVTSFNAVDDIIIYTFAVTNTGTMTLSDIVVVDTLVGLSCTIPTLAPMATNDTQCSATHQVTQDDIDAGTFDNSATATAPGAPSSTSTVETPGPTRDADFTIEKTANDTTDVQVNQIITYSHVVTNTGNVTLENITLTDSHTSASGTTDLTFSPSNIIATLAPDDVVTVTTTYTVTQDDIDAGADLTNTVSATAEPPTGVTPPTATDEETVTVEDADPAISVVKVEADGSGDFTNIPTAETFTFTVTNDGNVTLSGFTLTDDLTGYSCLLPDIAVGGFTTQCDDGTALSTTYDVLQGDVDLASITNEVTVTDGTLTATDDVLITGPAQMLAISLVKTATSGADFTDVGDEITYDYVVTNDSNITIFQPISIVDDKTTVTCPTIPAGGLPVDGTLTCTSTYAVTQTDLNTGFVTNEATASVTQSTIPGPLPAGTPTTATSAPAFETVDAAQDPSLTIDKIITPMTPTTFATTTDELSYDFTITNNGNVTIEAPITITDNQIGSNLTCGTVDLDPGDMATCTHVWTATQPAIDAGSITNVAEPVATFNGLPVPADTDTVTAVAVQTPELTIDKMFDSITTGTFASGQTITYKFEVTNSGNTTILTQPEINDTLIADANITIDDPFPAAGLAPTQSIFFTGTYVLTLVDIQLGSVSNTATATADGVTSDPDSVTTPEDVDPAMSVEKSADVTTFDAVDDPIIYTYIVTNTSEGSPAPALANAITITDNKFPGETITCDAATNGELLVGESVECSATYFVTQADLDAGEVSNSAVAETVFNGQTVLSPFDEVTVDGSEEPELNLAKEVIAGDDPALLGDIVTYRLTATNDGNQTLSNVQIDDPMIEDLTCTVGGVAAPSIVNLAPEAILICEGSYEVTQDDIDAQDLTNNATANATNPQGVPVEEATAMAMHPVDPTPPSFTIEKALTSGEPGSDYSAVGEEMTYTITIVNNGKITLDTVVIEDSNVAGTCNIGPLAPGQSDSTCEFVYEVKQTDIDRGFIDNTATAIAQPATPGSDTIEEEDTLRAVGPDQEPAFSLTKTADIADFAATDVLITYTYVVANTGNVTLIAAPTVEDDKIDTVTCDPFPTGGLLPGEFIECEATYLTLQEDLDEGDVTNIANVSSTEVPFDPTDPGGAQATETVPAVQNPGITVEKTSDLTTDVEEGDTITYSYEVENTGNVTLTNVMLDDQHTSASGTTGLNITPSATIASIAPDGIVTLEATYLVTQDDIDSGADLTNTVSLTAVSPDGSTPTATDDAVVTVIGEDPAIQAVKTVASNTGLEAGDTVTFEIEVENTGNVTLDTITLADVLRRQDGTLITPAPVPALSDGDGGTLTPDEIWTYEVVHTLTQDDIDAGGLSNSATVTGDSPFDTTVSDVSDSSAEGSTPTPFAIPSDPSIEAGKTVAISNTEVGETVTFEITITNTGNVTLTSTAITSDDLTRADGTPLTLATGPTFAGADKGSADGTLQVDEIATYTATYVLIQEDIDAGGIENTATVTGTPPTGSPVTDDVDTPAEVEIVADPSITMVKSLASGGPTFEAVDQILTYNFTVVNTGNVTLTSPITIDDPLITDAGGTIVCPAPPLAPMGEAVCEGTYAITQEDLDRGFVTNAATATVPDAPSVDDTTTTPARQLPALDVVKEAEELTSAEFIIDRVVDYTFTVTNTGNTTLTEPIEIEDNLIPNVICEDLPTGGLIPTGELICTGSYTVTATDVQLRSVTNLATATSGDLESPQTSETIPADGTPALSIAKTVAAVTDTDDNPIASGAFNAVGDKLTFEFTITNSGEVSFASPIPVYDDHFDDPIECFVPVAGNPDLISGEDFTCEATYIITQEDLDAGFVLNSAYAQTTFGPEPPTVVTSPPDTATAPADKMPAIEVVKTVDNDTYADIGDVLTYTFVVTNTGNQTLDNIVVSDPLIGDLDCTATTLAPMGSVTCTDTVTITQDELDDTSVVNTASVTAINPDGGAAEDDSDPVTSTAPTGSSVLSIEKSATPDPFGAVNSTITYGFAVTNDGPFTLVDVTVTDPLVPGFECVIATLDVDETNSTSCRMPYQVTQEDVDRGFITNEASVEGETIAGRTATAEDEITTPGPDANPALVAVKTASVPSTTLGSIITYTLTVTNTGNVTLTPPVLTDTMTRIATGRPTFLTTPFELQSGDVGTVGDFEVGEVWTYTATYELTQSDINAGGVSNTVVADAVDTNNNPATDTSDDGVSGNGDDNPTLVPITTDPVLDVVKSITTGGTLPGQTVVFRIEAANRGNVDIDNIGIVDTLTRRDGTDLSADASAPVRVAPDALATILSPGDVWAWEVSYELTQEDVDAGGISNLAVATGESPSDEPVTDTSVDDDPNDGNPAIDPTELNITPTPSIETTKVVTSAAPTGAGSTVTFNVTALNTGNVTLSGVTMVDTMTNADGTVLSPVTITPDPTAGVTLGAGDDIVWAVSYELTQDDVDSGGVSNTATATGTSPTGLPVSDVSDNDDDTDGNPNDDPTDIAIAQDTALSVLKQASVPSRVTGSLFETVFTITVRNDGNVTHRDLSITDDLTVFVAPATLGSVSTPTVTGLSAGTANAGYNGIGDTETLSTGSTLNVGDTATVEITVQFDIAAGSPASPNTARVTSDFATIPVSSSVTVAAASPSADILADKSVTSVGPYLAGSIVSYEVTFTNRNATPEVNLTLVDILPAGMAYVPGSATYDGAATPAPNAIGRRLEWAGVTIPAGATVTVTLDAQLLAGGGSYVNQALAVDSTGQQISNTATARVDVTPEAVFDCSDIIGKVFDDVNQNGYQDPPPDARAAISDQDYQGGKFGVSPAIVDQQLNGEPGLAGVRLVTVRGDIITTDEFGRYSVPCALLPGPTGSNFTLKLDERSLPTGYRVTTENPRTLRLTAGIMTEMNFGATLANLVDIDLLDAAFQSGSAQPASALINGVDGLIGQIESTPSVLRLTYYTNGESNETARARLRAVEALIRDRWRGPYRLRIETTIARVQ